MKRTGLISLLAVCIFLGAYGANSLRAQSAVAISQPGKELLSAFKGYTDGLANEFFQAESGRGSRAAELLEMVRIDYGKSREVMEISGNDFGKNDPLLVLMLYRVSIEHARGGDEYLAAAVWSEGRGQMSHAEKELGQGKTVRFISASGEWLILEITKTKKGETIREFLWYNLKTGEIREQLDLKTPKIPDPPIRKFVTLDDGASDIWWELQDGNGAPLSLTNDIRAEIAEVRHVVPALFGENRYAVWFHGVRLRLLDIESKTVSTLMTLFPDTEGLSGFVVSERGALSRIAFANYNPNRYQQNSKIFVLDLRQGEFVQKQKFDADLHFGVKGNSPYNLIIEGEDFWFKSFDRIEYRENPMTTDARLGFGEWDMATYPFRVVGFGID